MMTGVKRLLVTGASGLLGSHLVSLAQRRFQTLGLCSPRDSTASGPTVDLTDSAAVNNAVNEFRPEIVIHAAAMTLPIECEKHPDKAMRVNVDATHQLATFAAKL